MFSRTFFYFWLILSLAGASYATYRWASEDTIRIALGGHAADNANIKVSYHFTSALSEYSKVQKKYPIGQKLFINQQSEIQHYFSPYSLVACLKSAQNEILAPIRPEDGEFRVLDWSIPLTNIQEHRLDLPPNKITEIPLFLSINKEAEHFIVTERIRARLFKVLIYKTESEPKSWKSCNNLKKQTPIASLTWPITPSNRH